ncbi:MAG: hypothetical protein MK080_07755 [Opitutales bacterium]|nr:hypothetical protein [Opitutales bacterium]
MLKKTITIVAISFWVCGLSAVMIQTVGKHYLPMPAAFEASTIPIKAAPDSDTFHILHFLSPHCGCSLTAAEYLKERLPQPDQTERIIIAGQDPRIDALFEGTDWAIESWDADEVEATYGVSAGPWLMIADASGAVRYSGGYAATPVRSSSDFQDLTLLNEVKENHQPDTLPAFGCATSTRLQSQLTFIPINM